LNEIQNDEKLKAHILQEMKSSNYNKVIEANFGRRIGWYAMVRILKPEVVVETGIDHGVGSCVLAAAIIKNRREGFEGEYFGTDINLSAGQLFSGPYKKVGKIFYGDSLQTLSEFKKQIDLFINDSDLSSEYEYREYLQIQKNLGPRSIILGDNTNVSYLLIRFSRENSRKFYFFREEPSDHWYPRAGIGVSLP
jgi:predicted O-methyltransferase YrrM